MKHFYLIANPLKPNTGAVRDEIMKFLKEHGAVCRFQEEKEPVPGTSPCICPVPEDAECVITLGGDGTLLRAVRNLMPRRVPVLGINMGTMGYLTQISGREDLTPVLTALLEDRFSLEYRMMLRGQVDRDPETNPDEEMAVDGVALNEIVLTRNGGMQPIRFRIYVNGQYFNEYTADGMIVATPTGSTAYNLSAGGPIVTPCAQLIVLTPICAHALNSRSIILAGEDHVEIRVQGGAEGQKQMAVFDGALAADLDSTKRLRIDRAPCEAVLVRLRDVSFLDCLSSKMEKV